MKITKKVWVEWKKKENGENPVPPSVAKKVEEINKNLPNKNPPESFIDRMDFRVLYALYGQERTITEIFKKTKMGYSDVHRIVYELIDVGYINLLGKRKHHMGVYVEITQKGINDLVNWQDFHLNTF